MAENSKIEWTDATWNPITGCSVVSPGCTNCYAMRLAGGRLRNHPSRAGLTRPSKAGPVWTGEVRFNEEWLAQPLAWGRRRMVFVCAHGDLFHEDIPDEWIDKVFAVMALAGRHTFQVLTKRPDVMKRHVERMGKSIDILERQARILGRTLKYEVQPEIAAVVAGLRPGEVIGLVPWPLPNVWLGTSAERQEEADERIPELLKTPAAVRFASLEPLLGPIDLIDNDVGCFFGTLNIRIPKNVAPIRKFSQDMTIGGAVRGLGGSITRNDDGLHWVIVGGESGPHARDMNPAWARDLRDQCAVAKVAFFQKQMAHKAPIPSDLMVRQFPAASAASPRRET